MDKCHAKVPHRMKDYIFLERYTSGNFVPIALESEGHQYHEE